MFGDGVFHGTKRSTGSGSSEPPNTPRKLNGKVKGNITRDFERLDDELPLYEGPTNKYPDIGFASLASGDYRLSAPNSV
ncbi:hypothetical protein N7528_005233 [Penicillium herquei]|nr:hypothetical protein N7528_005233 [Penicillium herquei]